MSYGNALLFSCNCFLGSLGTYQEIVSLLGSLATLPMKILALHGFVSY